MPSDVYNKIKGDLSQVDEQLVMGKDLIKFLEESGEDVTEMKTNFRNLEKRRNKWEQALKTRGY